MDWIDGWIGLMDGLIVGLMVGLMGWGRMRWGGWGEVGCDGMDVILGLGSP